MNEEHPEAVPLQTTVPDPLYTVTDTDDPVHVNVTSAPLLVALRTKGDAVAAATVTELGL